VIPGWPALISTQVAQLLPESALRLNQSESLVYDFTTA
jgi:hypothetical protein